MDKTKDCIAKIEKEAETKVKELLHDDKTSDINDVEKELKKIMTDGMKKFEKEIGRPMCYSEMREAFG